MLLEQVRELYTAIAHESWRCFGASVISHEGKPALWVAHWPSGGRLLITHYKPWPEIRETWLQEIYADANSM